MVQMELQKVHDKVKKLTGKDMTLFRPPYGDYNNQVVEMADSMGYYPIQWDVETLETVSYTHLDVYKRQPDEHGVRGGCRRRGRKGGGGCP